MPTKAQLEKMLKESEAREHQLSNVQEAHKDEIEKLRTQLTTAEDKAAHWRYQSDEKSKMINSMRADYNEAQQKEAVKKVAYAAVGALAGAIVGVIVF